MVSRTSRQYTAVSVLLSLAGGIAGLILSYYAESASGATIVLVNAVFFLVCLALSLTAKK